MRIIKAYPPNYAAIKARFPAAAGQGIVFCWGDTIFAPTNQKLPKWIIAHEEVHSAQQAMVGGPEAWWNRYLEDDAFRYGEELMGHIAEWRSYLNKAPFPTRRERERMLEAIARRLSGPLYGGAGGADGYKRALAEIVTMAGDPVAEARFVPVSEYDAKPMGEPEFGVVENGRLRKVVRLGP